jgi:predicted DNA repair protein MutK
MATSSLLALIDDIASILDDVSILTKVAAKKTTGVLGDDLALNAQQVSGVKPERELPVVWAVCKGSFVNKAILVPAAMAISYFAPWLVTPLLMIGGAYLCFEGCEKLAHKYLHSKQEVDAHHDELVQAMSDTRKDVLQIEREKIKGAIRTDFVLSAEIIAITLGTVQSQPLMTQFTVLAGIAVLMTVGVYGLVGGIVKIDDLGLYLTQKPGDSFRARYKRSLGRGILVAAPYMMRALSVVGTAAMFLVGGGILTHGFPAIHHWVESVTASIVTGKTGLLQSIISLSTDAVTGIFVGAVVLGIFTALKQIRK